jgi:hypothetical protein
MNGYNIWTLEALLLDTDRRLSVQNQKFEAQLQAVKDRLDQARGKTTFFLICRLDYKHFLPPAQRATMLAPLGGGLDQIRGETNFPQDVQADLPKKKSYPQREERRCRRHKVVLVGHYCRSVLAGQLWWHCRSVLVGQ